MKNYGQTLRVTEALKSRLPEKREERTRSPLSNQGAQLTQNPRGIPVCVGVKF